jgi:FAD/FMN-containing dehydrogenase
MVAACRVVAEIIAAGAIPAALEILDRATILAVEASVYRAGYPTDAEAVLLVEMDGSPEQVGADAELVRAICARHTPLSMEEATTNAERKRLWKGRKGAFGAMGRLRPDLYVLDGVVPRTRLEETLRGIAEIGARHGVPISNVFHAGDGNLHPNISYDGRDREETARVVAAGHEILALCMAMGGSITGEHGIGSEKLAHVSMMFAAEDLDVMARVRRAFDPSGRCNPGKVLPERSSCAEPARWPQMVERVLREERA